MSAVLRNPNFHFLLSALRQVYQMLLPFDILSLSFPLRILEHVEKEGNGCVQLWRADTLPHVVNYLFRGKDTDAVSHGNSCRMQFSLLMQLDPLQIFGHRTRHCPCFLLQTQRFQKFRIRGERRMREPFKPCRGIKRKLRNHRTIRNSDSNARNVLDPASPSLVRGQDVQKDL